MSVVLGSNSQFSDGCEYHGRGTFANRSSWVQIAWVICISDGHSGIIVERLGLSNREIEIILYIMAERKDLFIAKELGISYNTLRTRLSRLFRKLGVHSRTGVVVAVFNEVIRRMGEDQARLDEG